MQNSDPVPRRKKKGVTRSVRDVEDSMDSATEKDSRTTTPKKSSGETTKNSATPSEKQDSVKQEADEGSQRVETPKKVKELERKGKEATPVRAGDSTSTPSTKSSNVKETNSIEKTSEKNVYLGSLCSQSE